MQISPSLKPKMPLAGSEPPHDCKRCPRLVHLREELKEEFPDWWNAPVPAWGDPKAWLGIIGLAPGKQGANRTGRPFTGDASGDLLFQTLFNCGMSSSPVSAAADDGVELNGAIILNAVKCLPPGNKPLLAEVSNCRNFLSAQIAELTALRIIVALGKIAHDSFLRHLGVKLAGYKFGHLTEHKLPDGRTLIDSYHCSRYNTQTGRLTDEMFEAVFRRASQLRDQP